MCAANFLNIYKNALPYLTNIRREKIYIRSQSIEINACMGKFKNVIECFLAFSITLSSYNPRKRVQKSLRSAPEAAMQYFSAIIVFLPCRYLLLYFLILSRILDKLAKQ